MRYLSANDLSNLVAPHALIAAIERGLIDILDEKVILRPRDHIAFDDNTLLTMPVVGAATSAPKWCPFIHPIIAAVCRSSMAS